MKSLALIAALLLVTAAHTSASDYLVQDGVWWQGLTDDARIYVVIGALTGYDSGYGDAAAQAMAASRREFGAHRISLGEVSRVLPPLEVPTFSKLFVTYSNDITNFYEQYPEAIKARVGDVLTCYADKPELTCDQVAHSTAASDTSS